MNKEAGVKVLMSEFPAGTPKGWAWFWGVGYALWFAFEICVVLGCVVFMIGIGTSNQ